MYTMKIVMLLYYFWQPITYEFYHLEFNECQQVVEELVQGHIDRKERVLLYSCTLEEEAKDNRHDAEL